MQYIPSSHTLRAALTVLTLAAAMPGGMRALASGSDAAPAPAAIRVAPEDTVITVSNSTITLGQDLRRGGSICHISLTGTGRNLVNIYDEGRYIQQSYYAGRRVDRRAEGQSPSWSPWQWNPIQGGNYNRCGSRILACEASDSTLYVSCVPMLWDMDSHEAEALMEQWTTLRGNVVEVRNRLTCHRTDSIYGTKAVANDQEIPAVYPISSLKHLRAYLGDAPFTWAPVDAPEVVELDMEREGSFWGKYPSVPEGWMAFVDDCGWGMGVYSPQAERYLAGRYLSDTDGEAHSLSTSYIAPLRTMRLGRDSVVEYTYYIILGDVGQIRSAVYALHDSLAATPQAPPGKAKAKVREKTKAKTKTKAKQKKRPRP